MKFTKGIFQLPIIKTLRFNVVNNVRIGCSTVVLKGVKLQMNALLQPIPR